jgi:hypothetical protein
MPRADDYFLKNADQLATPPQDMDHYFRSIDRASDRTRWHSIVLAVACILTLVATNNAMPSSWLRGRLELARAARKLYTAEPSVRDSLLDTGTRLDRQLYGNAHGWLVKHGLMLDPRQPIRSAHFVPFVGGTVGSTASDRKGGVSKVSGAMGAGVASEATGVAIDLNVLDLVLSVERLEMAKLRELIVLDIPALGVVLDVNDLGLIAGIAFMIMLVMRGMSIASEFFTVRCALQCSARTGCLPRAYDVITANAVLVVPLRDIEYHVQNGVGLKVWVYRATPMLVNALPVIALGFILTTNLRTYGDGALVSPASTLTSVISNAVLLLVVSFLAYRNLAGEVRLVKLLDDVALGSRGRIARALGIPEDAVAASPYGLRVGQLDRRYHERRAGDQQRAPVPAEPPTPQQ